jgi:hypothetical protein
LHASNLNIKAKFADELRLVHDTAMFAEYIPLIVLATTVLCVLAFAAEASCSD